MRPARLVVALAFSAFAAACDQASDYSYCNGLVDHAVVLAFQRTEIATLNEVGGRFASFRLANRSAADIPLEGWRRGNALWMESPHVYLQFYEGGWKDVPPLMGSFMSTGDSRVVVKPGDEATIFTRADAGVPEGVRRARVMVRSMDDRCFVSDGFDLK